MAYQKSHCIDHNDYHFMDMIRNIMRMIAIDSMKMTNDREDNHEADHEADDEEYYNGDKQDDN